MNPLTVTDVLTATEFDYIYGDTSYIIQAANTMRMCGQFRFDNGVRDLFAYEVSCPMGDHLFVITGTFVDDTLFAILTPGSKVGQSGKDIFNQVKELSKANDLDKSKLVLAQYAKQYLPDIPFYIFDDVTTDNDSVETAETIQYH